MSLEKLTFDLKHNMENIFSLLEEGGFVEIDMRYLSILRKRQCSEIEDVARGYEMTKSTLLEIIDYVSSFEKPESLLYYLSSIFPRYSFILK